MSETDVRLAEAKTIPMEELAERLGISGLVRTSGELVGPCPGCGGKDRFSINPKKSVIYCRKCEAKGDQIALVQLSLGLDFRAALDWLVGPRQELTAAQRDERQRRADEAKRKQREYERKARESSIRAARDIWFAAKPAEGSPVRDYLALRGITPDLMPILPPCLRFEPEARYVIPIEGQQNRWQTLHVGPAMVGAVVDAQGRVTAVHRTWIDLSKPKGKVVIADPRKPGETLPAKKVLGSKKGGAIRLSAPREARMMVMGEGLETTATALVAHPYDEPVAYWCGVDLGNMSGIRMKGKGLKFEGIPDLSDTEAWVPPPWVQRLVFLQDGDSDPRLTRAKLLSGLRRAIAHRPGLTAAIVHPGEGIDMNNLLMRETDGLSD